MIKIGLMSDTHINSKQCDYKALSTSIRELNESVDIILHAGDLTDGFGVYRGHEFNIEDTALDDVVQKTGDILDQVKVPMHIILGNHDESYQKRMGVDLGNTLLAQLPNINFHGFYQADVEHEGITFRLLHPQSAAYSIGYPAQKYLREIDLRKETFAWLILGHLHRSYEFNAQGINVIGVPSFQRPNAFSIRRGYGCEIGYDTLAINKSGSFKTTKRRFK